MYAVYLHIQYYLQMQVYFILFFSVHLVIVFY